MLRLFWDRKLFWSADDNEHHDENLSLLKISLKEEVNSPAALSFTITALHKYFNDLKIGISILVLADDEDILFIGNVSNIRVNMDMSVDVEAEDLLSVLKNNVYNSPESSSNVAVTYSSFVDIIVNALKSSHYTTTTENYFSNSRVLNVTDWYGFPTVKAGYIIQPGDSMFDIKSTFDLEVGKTLWELLITDMIGGKSNLTVYLTYGKVSIYKSSSVVTADNLDDICFNINSAIDRSSTPDGTHGSGGIDPEIYSDTFEYGENMISLEIEPSVSELLTGFRIVGEDSQGKKFNPTNAVSGCSKQIVNMDLVKKYGFHTKAIDFGTVPYSIDTQRNMAYSELFERGKNYADIRLKDFGKKYTLSGISHKYTTPNYEYRVAICSATKVVSQIHGVDEVSTCLAKEINFLDHSNDRYVLGPYIPENMFDPNITD